MKIEIEEGENVCVDRIKHEGKDVDVFYVQETRNGKRGELTVAMAFVEGDPVIAIAERGPADRYSLSLGRKVALGRLKKKFNYLNP